MLVDTHNENVTHETTTNSFSLGYLLCLDIIRYCTQFPFNSRRSHLHRNSFQFVLNFCIYMFLLLNPVKNHSQNPEHFWNILNFKSYCVYTISIDYTSSMCHIQWTTVECQSTPTSQCCIALPPMMIACAGTRQLAEASHKHSPMVRVYCTVFEWVCCLQVCA